MEIKSLFELVWLGTPLEQFDQLCKEEERVKITVSCYTTEKYKDGTEEQILTGAWSQEIRSSKDIFQFDYEDMKLLTRDTKKGLR